MPFVERESYQPAFTISPIPGYRVGLVIGRHMYVAQVIHSEITLNNGELVTLMFGDQQKQKYYRNVLTKLASQETALTVAPN